MEQRLKNEIEHGAFLLSEGAGEIWSWETPVGKVRWKRRVDMLMTHVLPDMEILEVGCGTGYFTKELVKTGANITAIDISPDLLNWAKSHIVANNVIFQNENAYTMNFDSEIFDSVIGSSVLHHLDVDKALREFYRVLKPGGSIYFTEPNIMNPQIALQKNILYIKKMMGDSPDETAFCRWILKKQMQSYRFVNVQITPFDFLHPKIPLSLIPFFESITYFSEKIPIISEIAGSLYIRAKKKHE